MVKVKYNRKRAFLDFGSIKLEWKKNTEENHQCFILSGGYCFVCLTKCVQGTGTTTAAPPPPPTTTSLRALERYLGPIAEEVATNPLLLEMMMEKVVDFYVALCKECEAQNKIFAEPPHNSSDHKVLSALNYIQRKLMDSEELTNMREFYRGIKLLGEQNKREQDTVKVVESLEEQNLKLEQAINDDKHSFGRLVRGNLLKKCGYLLGTGQPSLATENQQSTLNDSRMMMPPPPPQRPPRRSCSTAARAGKKPRDIIKTTAKSGASANNRCKSRSRPQSQLNNRLSRKKVVARPPTTTTTSKPAGKAAASGARRRPTKQKPYKLQSYLSLASVIQGNNSVKSLTRKDVALDKATGKFQFKRKRKCCRNGYYSFSAISNHHRANHMKIRYRCKECQKEYNRRSDFVIHYQNVHQGIRFPCSKCEKTFRSECGMRRHAREIHKKIRPHQCDSCGEKFPRKRSLTQHMEAVHMRSGNK